MKVSTLAQIVFLFLLSVLNVGCHKESGVSDPACVELEKTKDPVRQAELKKRCPRGGPGFQRSPVVNW